MDADDRVCRELLNLMRAYYDIAFNVFVDNVASLAVENCLMAPLEDLLTPSTIADMDDDELEDIACESFEVRELRTQMLEKQSSLQKCFDLCRREARKVASYRQEGHQKIGSSKTSTPETTIPKNELTTSPEATQSKQEPEDTPSTKSSIQHPESVLPASTTFASEPKISEFGGFGRQPFQPLDSTSTPNAFGPPQTLFSQGSTFFGQKPAFGQNFSSNTSQYETSPSFSTKGLTQGFTSPPQNQGFGFSDDRKVSKKKMFK